MIDFIQKQQKALFFINFIEKLNPFYDHTKYSLFIVQKMIILSYFP
jgi:hypothetical protein